MANRLRKYKNIDGDTILVIPEKYMRCPKCGAGWEANAKGDAGGLISEDDRPELDDPLYYADECFSCTNRDRNGVDCGWGGEAKDLYRLAIKRENLVPCPHCKGTGLTKGPKK